MSAEHFNADPGAEHSNADPGAEHFNADPGAEQPALVEHPDVVLDCRGQRCPLPVINLAKHLATVDIGQVVRVITDDPATARDIPAWCRLKGQQFVAAGTMPAGTMPAGTMPAGAMPVGTAEAAPAFDVRRTR